MIDRKEIEEAVEKTNEFNDTCFTNTQEMVNAIEILRDLAEAFLAVKGLPEKEECNKHLTAADTPRGTNYCYSCLIHMIRNTIIDECTLIIARDYVKKDDVSNKIPGKYTQETKLFPLKKEFEDYEQGWNDVIDAVLMNISMETNEKRP